MHSSSLTVTLFVACIGAISLASSIGIPANADVVTDWNNAALDAIRGGQHSAADRVPQSCNSSGLNL